MTVYLIDEYTDVIKNGVSRYSDILIKSLSNRKGLKIKLLLLNCKHIPPDSVKEESVNGIRVIKVSSFESNTKSTSLLLKNYIEMGSIIHFNWIKHGFLIEDFKKSFLCKIIFTVHFIQWRDFLFFKKNYTLLKTLNCHVKENNSIPIIYKNLFYKFSYFFEFVDKFITVTEDGKKNLILLNDIPPDKIYVIYNGIEFSKNYYSKSKKDLRKKKGFSLDEKIILYAGRIEKEKGIFDLSKAFQALMNDKQNNYRLILCGKGDYDSLLSSIKNFHSSITLTGNIDKKQLYDFYRMADVGVIPSYTEQCSYTMIEMMISKLPIIASPVDGLDEIINEKIGYKTKINFTKEKANIDTQDLTQKIQYALEHPQEAKEKAEQAYFYAKRHLNTKRMVKETIEVYKQVLSEDTKVPHYKPKDRGLVSIILPCYNAEEFLKECIDSILSQTYQNWELIIIDDASKDSTEKIIKSFKNSRIKYLKNNKNLGVVKSLNKGIKKAQGKYIARIDADDRMAPQRLERQIAFLFQNPEYAMVGSAHRLINAQGFTVGYYRYPQYNEEIQLYKNFINPFSHPSAMFKKDIFKDFNYSDCFPYCEDYELWFRILENHKGYNLPEALTDYRIHGENLSIQKSKEQKENTIALVASHLEKIIPDISVENIKIHNALLLGYGKKYFNSEDKIQKLDNWIEKIIITDFPNMDKGKIGKYQLLIKNMYGIPSQ
ncbi:glycosyltransferase [Ornithobacterium rhinotracheale]|uniref:glycosyltransferase n=1 Tax=Ornithobacterium rhinotracheale TaxID=28251 RepID=UPI003FA4C2D8